MIYIKDFPFFGFFRAFNRDGRTWDVELYVSETAPGQFLAYGDRNSIDGGAPILYKVCRVTPGNIYGREYNASFDNNCDELYYLLIPDDMVQTRRDIDSLKNEIKRLDKSIDELRQFIRSNNSMGAINIQQSQPIERSKRSVRFTWSTIDRTDHLTGTPPRDFGETIDMDEQQYYSLLASGSSGIEAFIRGTFYTGPIPGLRIINVSMS